MFLDGRWGDTVKAECKGTIQGTGNAILQDDSGKTEGELKCTATTGTAALTNASSTGTGNFTFTGCKVFAFFSCSTPGATNSGEIIINNRVTHLIYLHPIAGGATTDVGILITNVTATFVCAGFVNKTMTGNMIGRVTNPECTKGVTHHTVVFEKIAAGVQKYMQITTTGTKFDLTVGNELPDETTASQEGEGHINWEAGSEVKIDC